jgi:hypothetical protein
MRLLIFLHDALYAHKLSRTKASVNYRTDSAIIVLACERSTKLTKDIEDQHTDAGDGNGEVRKLSRKIGEVGIMGLT